MKKILLLITIFMSAFALNAQVTNSAMSGKIVDTDGMELIGATVQATHLPTGSIYGTTTNESGIFNIANMRSGGPYKVEVTYVGYQSIMEENIFLPLGAEFIFNRAITAGVELESVEVVGVKSSVINSNRTGASTNLGSEQINALPTISRSISDFTRLNPQAQSGSGFAGRDGRYNNIQIDGANFNNNFGLSSNNLPGGASQPISLDAIEEIQINVAPYDVRQTNFTGAGINAVTRSGTNTLSGSAYTFYRNQDFNGRKVGSDTIPRGDNTTAQIFGARLGGALIKNKLFFFVNAEYENNIRPGINLIPSAPGRTGSNVSRTTLADMDLVRNYVLESYNYDPGQSENYANEFTTKNYKALARLDWNINNNNKFTIRYNQVVATDDQVINGTSAPNPRSSSNRISLNSYAFENANYNFENSVRSITAELNSSLKSNLSNQLLATYTRIQDTRGSKSDIFPFIDIKKDGDSYLSLGYELFSYKNDVINNVYTITDNVTYSVGKHNITAGASFDLLTFGNSFRRYGTSYYRYDSLAQFLNNQTPSAYALTYSTLPGGEDPYSELTFGIGGIYLQDQIRVNDKFKLTAGVRFDLPLYLNELIANPAVEPLNFVDQNGEGNVKIDLSQWPKSRVLISPRVGFNYDPTGERKVQLRGGTGIFTGRAPFVWFTNVPTNSGMIQNTVELTGAAVANAGITFNPDPNAWADKIYVAPGQGAPGSIASIDPDLKLPQVWRSNLAVEFELPGATVFSIEGLYTKDLVNLVQYNANQKAPIGTMNAANGADTRPLFANNNAGRRVNTGISEAMILTNTDEGYSYTLTAALSKELSKNFFGSLAYTYTKSEDVSSNPGSQAASAWSNNLSVYGQNVIPLSTSEFAVPHRVIGSLSHKFEYAKIFATTISLFYEGANQGRFSYRYSSDFNQDGINGDLIYIPKDPSEITFTNIGGSTPFTAQEQSDAFFAYIEQDAYLSKHKGEYAERNGALLPWRHRFDLRLLQDFSFNIKGKKHAFQFSADVLNVGNMLNSSWGIRQFTNYSNGSILTPTVNAATGTATYQMARVGGKLPTETFSDIISTATTWGAQLGLRYIF